MQKHSFSLLPYLSLVLLLGLGSCEKDVVLDLGNQGQGFLVVEANITNNGQTQWIRLSRSSSFYENTEGEPVSGAWVKVSDPQQTYSFSESLNPSHQGWYQHSQIGAQLHEGNYRLEISIAGIVYEAKSRFVPVPRIDSISFKPNPFSQVGLTPEPLIDIFAHFADPPGQRNYYLFNLFVNGVLQTPRPADKAIVDDINLKPYVSLAVLSVKEEKLKAGDTLSLEIRSISKEMFDFYNAIFNQTNLSGNPFAGAPPANVAGNLSQGAWGFFQISDLYAVSRIYEPTP